MKEKEKLQLKRTIALIYRFIFIIFSVWGICQHIGFNILSISFKILNFTFLINVLSLICITAVFVVSVTRGIGVILRTFKNILTFCAIMILLGNTSIMGGTMSYQWILGVLLPLMLVIDWLLFDKKGKLNIYDPFLWLLGALLLIGILSLLFKNILGIDDFLQAIGLFSNKNELFELLAKALGIGIIMFILDSVLNAFKRKSFKKTFALIYRLIFLALEVYAFVHHIGTQLPELLSGVKYYYVLTNFLCAVCIAVLVVYNLIKFKSLKRTQNPFPELKGAFTVAILSSMLATLMLGRSVLSFTFSQMIFNYIAPLMMLFDWVLFDTKGRFEIFDPLIWTLIPAGYYIFALIYPDVISVYPGIYNMYNPELILGVLITVLVIGYIIYVADKIADR